MSDVCKRGKAAGIPIKCNLKQNKKKLFKEPIQTVSHITLWLLLLQQHIVSPATLKLGGENENGQKEDVCMIACNLIEYSSYRRTNSWGWRSGFPGQSPGLDPPPAARCVDFVGVCLRSKSRWPWRPAAIRCTLTQIWSSTLSVVVLQVLNYIISPVKVHISQS